MKLTKNVYPDKYRNSEYGTEFDARSQVLWWNCDWGKNLIKTVVNTSSLTHDNNKKNNLGLAKGPSDGLDDCTITAEANILLILQDH